MRAPRTPLLRPELEQQLLHEWSCWYNQDEVRSPNVDAWRGAGLASHCWCSASRLRQFVGLDQVPALVALLEEMVDRPQHPLVGRLSAASAIEWTDEPATWETFQGLVRGIAAELRDGPTPRPW